MDVEQSKQSLHDDGPRLFGTAGVVAACAGFVLLGALQAYFGPAIPALRARFGLAPSGAGLALSMFYGGAVVGVLVGGYIHPRVANRKLLITSFLVMAAGALGFGLSANWWCALAAAFVSGCGAGGMDYGLNHLFSVGFGRRSPAMLSILNAHYGVGAIAGPLAISMLGAQHYALAFAGTAGLLVVASWFFRTVRDVPEPGPELRPEAGRSGLARRKMIIWVVVGFLALYAIQVAVETGVGAWEPTLLQSFGHSARYAADATSGYWLMLTIGRFLVAPITLRWSEPTIVLVSCFGTTVCLGLATSPALAPYALAGAGLFNAPVFPAALPWLNRSAPDVRWAAMGAILTANLGGVAAGPLLGLSLERFGYGSVPWALTAASAVCLGLAMWLRVAAPGRSDVVSLEYGGVRDDSAV